MYVICQRMPLGCTGVYTGGFVMGSEFTWVAVKRTFCPVTAVTAVLIQIRA